MKRPPNSPNGSLNNPLYQQHGSLNNPLYQHYGSSNKQNDSLNGSMEIPSTPTGTWKNSLNSNNSTGNIIEKNMSELINKIITIVVDPKDLTSKDIVNILTDTQTYLSESSDCIDYFLSSTATYYIYKLITINSTNQSVCLAALNVVHFVILFIM